MCGEEKEGDEEKVVWGVVGEGFLFERDFLLEQVYLFLFGFVYWLLLLFRWGIGERGRNRLSLQRQLREGDGGERRFRNVCFLLWGGHGS